MNWRPLNTVEEVREAFERGDEVEWKDLRSGGWTTQNKDGRPWWEWGLTYGQYRARPTYTREQVERLVYNFSMLLDWAVSDRLHLTSGIVEQCRAALAPFQEPTT